MAPTRILQIVGTMNRAGAETFLMNLYRQIDRSRWQFDFVRFGPHPGDFDAEIEALGGQIIAVNGANLLSRMWSIYRLLRQQPHYRVAHGHTGFSSAWFLLATRFAGVRHRWLHSHSSTLKGGRLAAPYGKVSRRVGKWAATARLTCGALAATELHGDRPGVEMFPNCIDLAAFAPHRAARRRIRGEWGVGDDQILVIQVARLEPVKNHAFTLDLAEAFRSDDRVKIVTVGTGALEDWFTARITERGLSNRLFHAGLRHDIPAVMAVADVMILPSHHEGFPVVAVEGQAAGLRCLFAEAIDPSIDTGLGLVRFLAHDCVEQWQEAILIAPAMSNPHFSERCERLSVLNFDAGRAAEKYQAMLEAVIDR